MPLLCDTCEQLFSGWERLFAGNVFNPWSEDSGITIEYRDWLLKFCVSISWRVLTYLRIIGQDAHFTDAQKRACDQALTRWAGFLLGSYPHPGRFEQHLVLFDAIDTHTMPNMPSNMNRYMLRGIEMDLACSEVSAFTYAKLGPFLLFGIIEPFDIRLEGTKVHVREGTLGPQRYVLAQAIWDYWTDRAERHAAISSQLSPAQLAKIDAQVDGDLKRLEQSGTFAAMSHDVRLFGTGILRKR